MDKNPESSAGLYTAKELLTSMSLIFFVMKLLNEAFDRYWRLTDASDIGSCGPRAPLIHPCQHLQATARFSRVSHNRIRKRDREIGGLTCR